jgi:hypothetical protein
MEAMMAIDVQPWSARSCFLSGRAISRLAHRNSWCTMPSTSIHKFEYDPETRVLSVWFVASGRQYEFLDVPPETFADFKSAFAKGRYFNNYIRDRFVFRPVT